MWLIRRNLSCQVILQYFFLHDVIKIMKKFMSYELSYHVWSRHDVFKYNLNGTFSSIFFSDFKLIHWKNLEKMLQNIKKLQKQIKERKNVGKTSHVTWWLCCFRSKGDITPHTSHVTWPTCMTYHDGMSNGVTNFLYYRP